jgi:hypothetical protein
MAGGESSGQRSSRIPMHILGSFDRGLGASRPIKRRHALGKWSTDTYSLSIEGPDKSLCVSLFQPTVRNVWSTSRRLADEAFYSQYHG